MAGLHFDITGDNSNFLRKLEESRNGVRNTSRQIEESGVTIEEMFKRLTTAAAAFGVGLGAKQIVNDVARVRGEFQQLEVAFKTMLGSKEKADALMSQLVSTAAKTPFDLQSVAGGAKQLLAYGVAAEEINGILIRLGDIAAGLSIPLGDLVYLYGTTRAQGRLYTEDFNQFTGRGIPMVAELAKQFGVAENKVKKLVEEGNVGFPEVQKVIENLTNEGGKFGGLMEAQSKTITGQISNIEDSITNLYNKLGQSSEGVINLALGGVSSLLENYEKVGEAIAVAVTAYGSYKAVLMATTAMQTMNNKVLRQAVVEKSLAAASGISLSNAEAIAAARTNMLTLAQNGLVKSLKAAAAATLANPYVLMAAAITSLAYGIYKLSTYETEAEKAQRSLNEAIAESEAASLSEQRELAKLKGELSALSKGTKEYESVKNKIVKGFGKYYEGLDEEITRVGLTEAAYNKLTEAIQKSYGARQYEKFSKEQQTALDASISENLLSIQNRLYKELGEEEGARVYTQLRNKIFSKEISLGKGHEGLVGIDEDLLKSLDKVAGKESGLFDIQNRKVEGYVRAILKSQNIADDIDKKARVRFGIGDNYKSDDGGNSKTETAEVKDKTYWEQKKKEAESALYALDISKKGSEEWKKYIKDIDNAQKQIDKYSSFKSIKVSDANEQLKIQEELNKQLISLRRRNQQEEINLMAEGSEKKKAQADLDFQNSLDTLEKRENEWRKAQGGKLTNEQKDELSKSEENAYKNYEKTVKGITKAKIDEDKRGWQEYYIAYGEYSEKRKAIEEKYNDELSKVEKDSPQYATLIAQRKEELDDLDETLMKDSGLWGDFFSDFSNRSSSAIKSLIVDIQKLIDYMNGVEGAQIPSIFKDDENVMKSINDAMSNPEAAQKFVKNLQGSLGKFKKMVEKDNPFELISKGFKEKDSKSLEDGFNGIAAAASELGNIMEGLGVKSDSALGKMTSAISGTASMAAQGAAIGGPWGAAIGAAIGLTTSLVGMFGADYSAYNNLKQEYEGLIDVWDTLISKKQKYIDIDYGDEARKVAEETKKLITDNEERYRELLRTLAASGSSKGSHSLGVRIDKRLSDDDYRRISEAIGQTVTNEYQFWELSAEQLEKLLQDPKLVSVLNTVNEDFVNYIQKIIDGKEQLEEIEKKSAESLTGTTFESFFDDYKSMLLDMDKSNQEFAESFGEYLRKAILENLIANKYRQDIQNLYDAWVKASDTNGDTKFDLDDKEADDLKNMEKELTDKILAERDALADAFGWTDSAKEQEASRGFGTEMTHEDAGELSGRFAALQITGEESKNAILNMLAVAQAISLSAKDSNEVLSEIRNLMIMSNGYLEDISEYAKKMILDFGEKLNSINESIKKAL